MKRFSLLALVGLLPAVSSAQLFSDDFDSDHTSAWKFNSSLGTTDLPGDSTGGEANFFFDYSKVGIPSAPHSTGGTTIGLKLQSNVAGGVFSGISVSPTGQSFSGNYTLTFDAWQNFVASGNGSTQMTMGGIGGAEGTAQFPGGTFNGAGFAASSDGGTAQDFRAYNAPGASIGTYDAGSQNNTAAYYTSRYQGAYPAGQTTLYPAQTGTVQAGALGMAWHTWTITKTGSAVEWFVDGSRIAKIDNASLAGNDIFLGHFDINAGSSSDANNLALNFGLIDNVKVTAVPEPAPLLGLGLGAMVLLRRRKRA